MKARFCATRTPLTKISAKSSITEPGAPTVTVPAAVIVRRAMYWNTDPLAGLKSPFKALAV